MSLAGLEGLGSFWLGDFGALGVCGAGGFGGLGPRVVKPEAPEPQASKLRLEEGGSCVVEAAGAQKNAEPKMLRKSAT